MRIICNISEIDIGQELYAPNLEVYYVITTKNPYGITGITYNIFTKNIIGSAEISSKEQIEMI